MQPGSRASSRPFGVSQSSVRGWVVLVVALGLSATVGLTLLSVHMERLAVEEGLRNRDQLAANQLEGEMQRYLDVVSSVAAGLSAQYDFNTQDFTAVTAPMLQAQLAGASGVSFVVPATSPAEIAAQQAEWRSRGAPGLTLTPTGTGEHFFLVAARTLDAFKVPVGTDISVLPEPSQALREARRFGRAALSDPFVLLMDSGWPPQEKQRSVIIAAPVDDPNRGVLRGWVVASLRTGSLLAGTLQGPVGQHADATLAVQLRDGSLQDVAVRDGGATTTVVPDARARMSIAGRTWTLTLRPTVAAAEADSERFIAIATAIGGVLVTALLAGLAYLLLTSRRKALRDSRRQAGLLGAVLDSISDGVGVVDETGQVILHNPAFEAVLGAEAAGDPATWRDRFEITRIDGHTPMPWEELPLNQAVRGEPSDHVEMVVFEKGDPEGRPMSVSARPLDPRAGMLGAVAVFQDISARMEAEAELRAGEERFRFAFDHARDGMAVVDWRAPGTRGRFVRVNAALCAMLGYTEEQLLQRGFEDVTHPEDRGFEAKRPEPGTGAARLATFKKRYLHADGHVLWVEVDVSTIRGADGRERYSVAQIEDVTARLAEEERLAELALHDPLTGLDNRVLLMDRLTQAAGRSARNHRLVGVIFGDLDGFKPVNDLHGHAAGDEVLRQVANRMRRAVRPADTVARIGGDEFVVLCEELEGIEQAEEIAGRLREAIAEPMQLAGGAEVRIGISTGLVTAAGPGVDPEGLLHHADQAMYANKRAARA